MGFTGLDRDAIAFFAELRANNTKQWWTANKARYDSAVRGPFEELGAELEPEFGPVKIFRPYRDVRFSADKTPYKLQIGMVSRAPTAHYLQLDEDGLLAAGGLYDPAPPVLARFREIVDDARLIDDLQLTLRDLEGQGFELMRDDALKTAPRGFSADHPHIDLLRLKRLAVGTRDDPADWMWSADAFDRICALWRAVSIWCDWLHENLGPELAASLTGGRRGERG